MSTPSLKTALVDPDKCIGCNTCPLIDPDTFELDQETYKAFVKKTAPPVSDKTEMATSSCPTGAISIVDQ